MNISVRVISESGDGYTVRSVGNKDDSSRVVVGEDIDIVVSASLCIPGDGVFDMSGFTREVNREVTRVIDAAIDRHKSGGAA